SKTNVARIGQVAQSSTYGNAKPENAIDGNRASNYNQGSCAHTNNNLNPWWRLDLLKPYKINTVTITNRQDCCPERINGAEIRIGNSLNDNGNANPRCAVISSIAAGASQTFVEVDGTLSGKSCPIHLVWLSGHHDARFFTSSM
uniref:Fucolectin tachylectin-4 pentraxin-1 domain-containing protein n=1 Tax=Maylandia zebra TaxID=106582 RepID=A0A3P9AW28_9CICH